MDRARFSTLAHRDHVLCNPLDAQKVERVLEMIRLREDARVLDIGCGKGEILLRLIERYSIRGIGVDTNEQFLREARERAIERGCDANLELHERDFSDYRFTAGSFDLVICLGSTHACGGYAGALRSGGTAARRGGYVLIGEGYWKREPDPEYLSALGATRDEYHDHAGNVSAGESKGLIPVYSAASSSDEWDDYEGRYCFAIERFAHEHPDDPDRAAMLDRIRKWRDAYQRWGRDTLGFGLYLFMKDED